MRIPLERWCMRRAVVFFVIISAAIAVCAVSAKLSLSFIASLLLVVQIRRTRNHGVVFFIFPETLPVTVRIIVGRIIVTAHYP